MTFGQLALKVLMMKKSIALSIHIGFWISYFLLLFVIAVAATQGFSTGPSLEYSIKFGLLFTLVPSVITFYLNYFFLFPKYIQTKKITQSILYSIIISIGSALIGGLLITSVYGAKKMFADGYKSFSQEIISMELIAFATGIMSVISKGFISWYNEIKVKEELTRKNHQIELDLVKSQLV